MDKDKLLIVIPAYNEEDNIEKVLHEIKKEINYADILVINDSSTDNTLKIVKKNKIKYITNIYNLKYALSIQVGIKYAYYNNYDYVIQMDADGQHIAKEALKLYQEIKKSDCDIVIGSRFVKKSGYKSPLFRRIGTKMFELLIRLFCKQTIKDPLSGFQCLNKKVIKKYALYENYPEYPDANLIIEMLLEGYKIKEVPIKMRLRKSGVSMHAGIIKPLKYMIEQFYTCIIVFIQKVGKRRE